VRDLGLQILHLDSQIANSLDPREITKLKHQRWTLHLQLAKMQEMQQSSGTNPTSSTSAAA
jgi:hypothetical protein